MADAPVQGERERLEREIERLAAKRRQLDLALGEFLHEGRRTHDALERAGGREPALEAKARHLAQNAAMSRRELEETDREIEDLRRRLAALGTGK